MNDHYPIPVAPKPRLLRPEAYAKCDGPRGCGATLKTALDAQLHCCDAELTTRAYLRGDRRTRSSLA